MEIKMENVKKYIINLDPDDYRDLQRIAVKKSHPGLRTIHVSDILRDLIRLYIHNEKKFNESPEETE